LLNRERGQPREEANFGTHGGSKQAGIWPRDVTGVQVALTSP